MINRDDFVTNKTHPHFALAIETSSAVEEEEIATFTVVGLHLPSP